VAEWKLPGPDDHTLTRIDVARFLGLKDGRALDRLIKAGQFPHGRRRAPLGYCGAPPAYRQAPPATARQTGRKRRSCNHLNPG
jgi:hypothetical protein